MKKAAEFYGKYSRRIIMLQIVLCVLTAIIINCMPSDERKVNFDERNLSGGAISGEGYAYIDETDEAYGIILDTVIEGVKRGRYKIRVEYETGYDDNGFIVQALIGGDVLNTDIGNEERTVALKSFRNSQEVHAWLKKDSDLRVAVHFCGGGYLQIKNIVLYRVPNYTPVILLIACFMFLNFVLYEHRNFSAEEIKRRRFIRGGIAGIALLGSIPLINDYNISGHDYKYHIYCMEGIAEGLLSGQFPVRIMPNWWNEFGDGAPLFYSHFLLYIPAVIIILGYTIQTAYKCYIIFVNLMTAWIAYKCFLKISEDSRVALLGSLLYSLSLYRLIDIYVRCAVGEYTALTFLPLVLLGIYLIEEKEGWIYLALGLTGCIQSHALACVMIALFFLLFGMVKMKWLFKKKVFCNFCKAGIAGVFWNLWFLVPFLNMYGMKNYKINSYDVDWKLEEKGISFQGLFKMFLEGSGENSFVMGIPLLAGLFLSAGIAIAIISGRIVLDREQNRRKTVLLNSSVWLALLSIVLSMNFIPYSKIGAVHAMVNKLLNTFEFPFRFMVMASLLSTSAIVSAYSLWNVYLADQRKRWMRNLGIICADLLVILAVTGTLLSCRRLSEDKDFHVKHSEYYTISYIQDADKWLPLEADRNELSHTLSGLSEDIIITDYRKEYTNIDMTCINGGEEGYVDVPLFFYPCYRAKDRESGQMLPLTYGENARIRIILPAGYQGTIELKVSERKLWRAAELISIFSVLLTWYVVMKNLTVEDIMVKIGKGKHKL